MHEKTIMREYDYSYISLKIGKILRHKGDDRKMYDLIIIGAGPAGMAAGIYAQRAMLNTLLLEKGYVTGGQVINTYEVDNYPGLPGVSGMELGEAFENHADKMGLAHQRGQVREVKKADDHFIIETKNECYQTKSVIIATGARHRHLGVPGEEELSGMGVSYCATCDGAFFAGRTVAVVGGGDVALEDAIFLARGCEKVYVIHRRDEFRGAQVLQKRLKELENMEILWDTVVEEIQGTDQVEGVRIKNIKTDETSQLPLDGVFIAVGILPNTEDFQGLVAMDDGNYIVAGEDCVTSQPGIFVAGDVRTKPLRQIVTAAADGACAVTSVQNYLLG